MGAVAGYGYPLQGCCLQGFNSLGFHHTLYYRLANTYTKVYLSKVLSGCIRGLGPCGLGSNPSRETNLYRVGLLVRSLALQAGETSSILVHDAKFRLVHIVVIIADCLSVDGSSILPRVARFYSLMV